jgi:hypothetical protein
LAVEEIYLAAAAGGGEGRKEKREKEKRESDIISARSTSARLTGMKFCA